MDPTSELRCPITQMIMFDPCVISDGQVFEREAIEKWFERKNECISPVTMKPVSSKIFPCIRLNNLISDLLDKQPKYLDEQYLPESAQMKIHDIVENDDGAQLEIELRKFPMLLTRPFTAFESKTLLHICCEFSSFNCTELLVKKLSHRKQLFEKLLLTRDKHSKLTPILYIEDSDIFFLFQSIIEELPSIQSHLRENGHICLDTILLNYLDCRYITPTIDNLAFLLDLGAVPNSHDGVKSALHNAVSIDGEEYDAIVEFLCTHGADPENVHFDKYGDTPLMVAAFYGYEEKIRILIKHGAPLDTRNPDTGRTALHKACSNGMYSAVEILLEEGANPKIKDYEGVRPIDLCSGPDFRDIRVLINKKITEIEDAKNVEIKRLQEENSRLKKEVKRLKKQLQGPKGKKFKV